MPSKNVATLKGHSWNVMVTDLFVRLLEQGHDDSVKTVAIVTLAISPQ